MNPKFATRQDRLKNKKELYSILDEVFLSKTGEEWLEILEAKIPIAPINTIDKALADPQTLSRNMVPEVDYGNGKRLKILGNPIKMSEIEREVFTPAPHLGQHTEEIMTSLLNYSPERVRALREQKII
jgi:crotonobetainyl-CoA:carnitine CoA-transferase CaiB-like acyl-CoA transferase